MRAGLLLLFGWLAACAPAHDRPVLIATASSFRPALEAIRSELQQMCATSISISSASTGALITQANQGAPFDLLISADIELSKLVKAASIDPPFARSPLALWVRPEASRAGPVAIANPATAPFGRAAMQVIGKSDIELVTANSASQAFSFVKSGAASAGYVPLVLLKGAKIPKDDYEVIDPDSYFAIMLQVLRLNDHPQTDCLARSLAGEALWPHLAKFGYELP